MAFVEGGEARVWCTVQGTGFAVLTLGIKEFLVFGCCVGGPFILKLCELAAGRVVGAVLEQPARDHRQQPGAVGRHLDAVG